MNLRARLAVAAAIVIAIVALFLSAVPTPASAFPTQSTYDRTVSAAGAGPIAVGDLNGDGLADIVAVDDGTGSFNVFIQSISGLPAAPTTTFQGTAAGRLLMRDVNGDGAKDLIALETNATRIYIQNAGTFGPQTWTLAGTPGYALDAGDLNGDGTVDLAILTADTLQVWFQTPSGTWPGFPSLNITALGYDDLAIADLSGDGLPDVLLVRPHELRVFAQTPGNLNTTGLGRTLDTGNGTLALTAADGNR